MSPSLKSTRTGNSTYVVAVDLGGFRGLDLSWNAINAIDQAWFRYVLHHSVFKHGSGMFCIPVCLSLDDVYR